jgi:hypothetical protein
VGAWESEGGDASFSIAATGGEFRLVDAVATYVGAGGRVNTGDAAGELNHPADDTLIYLTDSCQITMVTGRDTLNVEDNLGCGGMNITYSGTYTRK